MDVPKSQTEPQSGHRLHLRVPLADLGAASH
jgi:hypothetical protein